MKLSAIIITAVLIAGLANCNRSHAQATRTTTSTQTSPNLMLITPNGTNPALNWTGQDISGSVGGNPRNLLGNQGGPGAFVDTATTYSPNGGIYFSYGQSTVRQIYAFNTALQNSGMSITGLNYSWQYWNQDYNRGSLSANINVAGTNGSTLANYNYVMGQTTSGWTTFSGTETFATPFAASQISGIGLSFTGQDDRYWAGYYGPAVHSASLTLNYTFDQCVVNPLSSPSCSGYQAAYTAQQCTANPLYNPSCPGYQAAYTTQQCSANPLYSTACPGYQTAYLTAQCTNNPLYSSACPGYQQAYHDQQCSVNPLSATDCPGYAQANLNAQCIQNSLYSPLCSGYKTAYAIKYLVPGIDSSAVNQSLSGTAATAASNPTSVNTNGTVSTTPSATGNSTVDSVISTPSTTSATSVSPAATNSVITPSAPAGSPMSQAINTPQGNTQSQAQQSNQSSGGQQQQANTQPQGGGSQRREQPNKEQQQEKQQQAVAANKGAKSLDEQKAAQNAMIASMGSVPGFDAYNNVVIRDSLIYRPFEIYRNQANVDNRRNSRGLFGPSDQQHEEMMSQQYKLGE